MSEQSAAAPASGAGEEPKGKPQISFEDFAKVDLRVAKVLEAAEHPDADRLLVLKVDDGSGTARQLCAGIKGHYEASDLVGRTIVIVANLAPRKIRGQESNGMLLAASDAARGDAERRVVLLTAESDLAPGSVVT
jgi:methionyl-tRNA synthetase